MKSRIGWLVAGDEMAGVAEGIRGLAGAVVSRNFEPLIIAVSEGPFTDEMVKKGYHVVRLGMPLPPCLNGGLLSKTIGVLRIAKYRTSLTKILWDRLANESLDAIHVRWLNLMPAAAWLAHRMDIPCFWQTPNSLATNYPFQMNQRIVRHQVAKYAVQVIANSRYTATTLAMNSSVPKIMYPGADASRFTPQRTDPITRKEIGLPDNAIVLGIFGRVEESKGQDRILKAILDIKSQRPLHLLLIGGPQTGAFANSLRAIADRAGAADRLHLRGWVKDPHRYYAMVDIAVNARVDPEPFGFSVVEAMLMRKPVLVHALGGPAETVLDGRTGWHVSDPSVASFRAGIIRALADESRWSEMGSAALRLARAEFSLETTASQYTAMVRRQIIDHRQNTRRRIGEVVFPEPATLHVGNVMSSTRIIGRA